MGKPTRVFQYPGGKRMCHDGKVRAAEYGHQILTGEETVDQIEEMARKGQRAVEKGADTHKKNLIALIVSWAFKRGDLEEYVNKEGDFLLNEDRMTNLSEYEMIANRFRRR